MRVSTALTCLILIAAPAWTSGQQAEIYRWVDEDGRVHFGDCPPQECPAESIAVPTEPPPERIRETRERTERLREFLRDVEQRRDARGENGTEPPRRDDRTLRIPRDIPCFADLTANWGGRIADRRQPLSRRPLSAGELERLIRLFRILDGRHHGRMRETTCIEPQASPPIRTEDFRANLEVERHSEQVYRINAHGVETDTGSVVQQHYGFLLSREGLRAAQHAADLWPELDRPQHDVRTLEVDDDLLVFYSRRGGAVHRVRVMVIRRSDRRFRMSEYSYAQGRLAGTRHWSTAD